MTKTKLVFFLLFHGICAMSPAIPDILKCFSSSTLPWDNYYRISGAVFPPTKLPSLLINVRVVFVNESSPSINSTDVCGSGRKADDLNYKWSMADLYVSSGVSLNTMTFFSLLTIFPQRRSTDLCLKLPHKFRSGLENRELIKYSLSKLQSIAIRPTALDASKNTVRCIAVDPPEDNFCANCPSSFSEPLQDALCGVWIYLILIASAILSLCISLVLNDYLKRAATPDDVEVLENAKEEAAKDARDLIRVSAVAARAAAQATVNGPAVTIEKNLIGVIESAWTEARKIVTSGLYKQLTEKAVKAMTKVAEKAVVATAMAAAVKEKTSVALADAQAQAKLENMTLTGQARSSKSSTVANAATTEIIDVVRAHIVAGRGECVMTAARQRGAEAARSEIAISTTDEKEIKVLHKMAEAAANVAAGIAVGAAEAATLIEAPTAAQRSAEAKRHSAESEAKKAVKKVLNGIGARGDAAEAVESKTGAIAAEESRSETGALAVVVDVKNTVIEVAVGHVMDTVRNQVIQTEAETVALLLREKEQETRQGAANDALRVAKQEIEMRQHQKRDTKMPEEDVLSSIAETAAEAAAKVLIPATAEAAERMTAILSVVERKRDEMEQAAIKAAENAADDHVATTGKKEIVAAIEAAKWAAVAAKALAAKEVAAKAASAARDAMDKAAEAATPKATKFMLGVLFLGECVLLLVSVPIRIANCAKDGACKDVGFWVYVVYFLLSFIISVVIYNRKKLRDDSSDNDKFALLSTWIYPSLFSSIHHLMWICLGIMTEPFWAFPVFILIGSCLFAIYFKVHSFSTSCWKKSENVTMFLQVQWYPMWYSVGCVLSFFLFVFAVMLVGQRLFSDSFISNIAQSFLVLVVTLLFRYLQPPEVRN